MLRRTAHLTPVEEAAYRTDHTGRPSSKHLQDPAALQGSQQLLHAHGPLSHLKLTLKQQNHQTCGRFVLISISSALLTHNRARSSRDWRVTPGRMIPSRGGVTNSLSGTDTHTHTHKHEWPTTASSRTSRVVLTSILISPIDEEVHGSDLGDLLLFSVQPQDLLTAAFQCLILHGDGRPVVPADV